jgi:hypothetical protein
MYLKKTLTSDKVILLEILNQNFAKISSHNPDCLGVISTSEIENMGTECPHCSESTLFLISGREKGKAVRLNNNNNKISEDKEKKRDEKPENKTSAPSTSPTLLKKRKTDVTSDIITTHKSKTQPNDMNTLNDLILTQRGEGNEMFSLWKSFQGEERFELLSKIPPILFLKMHEEKVLPFVLDNLYEVLPSIIKSRTRTFSEEYTNFNSGKLQELH